MSRPGDFFLGVNDFFGMLLPGAVCAAVFDRRIGPDALDAFVAVPRTGAAGWCLFAVVAYVLGHFVFFVGSLLDASFQPMRRALGHAAADATALTEAERAREASWPDRKLSVVSTFQWARSALLAKCPAAAADVHRLEADSKFFRSLVVVAATAALVFAADGRWREAGWAALAVAPCYVRYYERRRKAINQAYVHAATLYRLGALGAG